LSALVALEALLLDLQSDILNYLVQESLAHTALIFAVLLAAFTFATGFHRRLATAPPKLRNRFHEIYFGVLSVLFFIAIYAFFRFIFYAGITSYLLGSSDLPTTSTDLGSYWRLVRDMFERGGSWYMFFSGINIGANGWVGAALAALIAAAAALLVTYLAGENPEEQFPLEWTVWPLAAFAVWLACWIPILRYALRDLYWSTAAGSFWKIFSVAVSLCVVMGVVAVMWLRKRRPPKTSHGPVHSEPYKAKPRLNRVRVFLPPESFRAFPKMISVLPRTSFLLPNLEGHIMVL
jgi:hypothetical protein